MKFKCGLPREEAKAKVRELRKWQYWFAWYPVSVSPGDCRWLEYVRRRRDCFTCIRYDGTAYVRYAGYDYEEA